ncbi:hypothetical protein FRB99_000654 [Tulasnella sp. 403]|nr:hypothetical protein FRB99_000654 [Tulasnella sp. 403]
MSVLVQRPHQIPGIITLPRPHKSSPRRQPQPANTPARNTQPTVPTAILSPKVSRRQRAQVYQPAPNPPATHSTPRSAKRRSNGSLPNNNTNSPKSQHAIPASSLNSSTTVSASEFSVLSASSTTSPQSHPPKSVLPAPASTPNLPATPPRKPARSHQHVRSAPATPSPAESLPVPANRRRARSPRPTAKLPPVFPGIPIEEDDVDDQAPVPAPIFTPSPPHKRGRQFVHAPSSDADQVNRHPTNNPATWQQAALLKKSPTPGALTPVLDPATAVAKLSKTTSLSTPTTPIRSTPSSVFPNVGGGMSLFPSSAMPSLASTHAQRRSNVHSRAPSYPSFPSYQTFPSHHAHDHDSAVRPPLEALFASAQVLDGSIPGHATQASAKSGHIRGSSVSSSLPHPSVLHARMQQQGARRERTLTGGATLSPGKFAGASFQHAPDTMVLPKPVFSGRFGMLASGSPNTSSSEAEDSSSSSAEEADVVDLGGDSADEDEVVFLL